MALGAVLCCDVGFAQPEDDVFQGFVVHAANAVDVLVYAVAGLGELGVEAVGKGTLVGGIVALGVIGLRFGLGEAFVEIHR